MLMQRLLCRSWQSQLPRNLPRSSSLTNSGVQILHHARPPRPPALAHLRAFRSSTRHQKPPPPPPSAVKAGSLQAMPFENYLSGGPVPMRNVVKAVIFTGAFGVGTFLGATVLEYENTRNTVLERARQTKFNWLRRKQHGDGAEDVVAQLKRDVKRYWEMLTPGEKVFAPLCALNLLVFGLWRIPALRNTMMTYFCSNPAGRAVCWPMFLSTFSHYSTFHIFANMYVLHSFCNAAVSTLGKEQFLAVYLSAGVLASLSSIVYKAVTSQAGLSLGASGAIMGILAFVCAQYPDTQLSILFLPMLTFSAGAAIKVVMGIDLAGCLLGWKFFDHAAHLGGALFGIFWVYFGTDVWQQRIPFLTLYHDWRKTK